jgi:hypothetical protein
MSAKTFHISDILSVTTGRLVSNRHIDGVYDVIGHLVGRPVYTQELVIFLDQSTEEIHNQLKWTREVPEATDEDMRDVPGWLGNLEKKYGSEHTLTAASSSFEDESYDPIGSLFDMMGPRG